MADQQDNLLRKFPPEIRGMIFIPCLLFAHSQNDPIPTLLAALRPDATLYEEALDIFYKENRFLLRVNHTHQFESLKIDTFKRIRSLRLMCWKNPGPEILNEECLAKLRLTTGLKYISITVMHSNKMIDSFVESIENHPNITKLRFTSYFTAPRHLQLLEQLEKKIGSAGKSEDGHFAWTSWTWEAGYGSTLFPS